MGSAGCLAEEPPPLMPEADEVAPPVERGVVSSVAMGRAEGGASARAPRASDADRVRPAPVFFRLGAGYGAVGRVDLGPCRDHGLDPGYVRLRVTFGGDGEVARATVESPTPPTADALACISRQLKSASVPVFEGGDVTLSKSVFVVTDARSPDVIVHGDNPPPPPATASR